MSARLPSYPEVKRVLSVGGAFMRHVVAATLASAVSLGPTALFAQRIRVAVDLSDSAMGGVLSSGFAAAFRSLGDVDVVVVPGGERPDYLLVGVAVCSPDPCASASSYSVALRFSAPIQFSLVQWIAARAARLDTRPSSPPARAAHADSLADEFWPQLREYEKVAATWVVLWGRSTYEQAIRALVVEIDSRCFNKARAQMQAMASSAPDRWQVYDRFVRSRTWLC